VPTFSSNWANFACFSSAASRDGVGWGVGSCFGGSCAGVGGEEVEARRRSRMIPIVRDDRK
jgi:hypothetical protein